MLVMSKLYNDLFIFIPLLIFISVIKPLNEHSSFLSQKLSLKCLYSFLFIFQSPPNGKVSYQSSLFNHKSSYSCNEGYELKGDKYRTCNPDGSWSGHLPQCHR